MWYFHPLWHNSTDVFQQPLLLDLRDASVLIAYRWLLCKIFLNPDSSPREKPVVRRVQWFSISLDLFGKVIWNLVFILCLPRVLEESKVVSRCQLFYFQLTASQAWPYSLICEWSTMCLLLQGGRNPSSRLNVNGKGCMGHRALPRFQHFHTMFFTDV